MSKFVVESLLESLSVSALSQLEIPGSSDDCDILCDQWSVRSLLEILARSFTPTRIFVCGCFDDGWRETKTNEIFTVSKNEWHDAPDLPETHYGHGITFADGRVFVLGGSTNACVAFSISKNEWEMVPPMTIARSLSGVAVVGDRIFVIGGRDDRFRTLDSVEVYDVSENKWSAPGVVAPMPTPRFDFGVAVIGKRIFTFGGYYYGEFSTVEVLDTETNAWTELSPMPIARLGIAVTAIGHRIWCFGGLSSSCEFLDAIMVFDVDTGEWAISEFKIAATRSGAKAMVIDGMIWVVGGSLREQRCNLVEIFNPITGSWTSAPNMKTPRLDFTAVAF